MQPIPTTESHQFMIRKQPLISRQVTTVYLNDQLIELAIKELQHNESILDARLAAMEC